MEPTNAKFTLLSVSEVPGSTVVNRSLLRNMDRQPVTVDINVKAVPDFERSTLSIIVSCSYIAVVHLLRARVMTSSVVASFEIENMRQHVSILKGETVIDDGLLETMLGVAVGSLRGIIAVRTAGTPLRNTPLPILDLKALMYRVRYGKV